MSHIATEFPNHFNFVKSMIENGISKIVITGSCFEYGMQYGPMDANGETAPNTPYALSKDMLHKSLRMLEEHLNFQLIWTRLFYLYGPGQDKNSVLGQLETAIERGDPEFKMSLGEQLFDYLPIEAAAASLVKLVESASGTYNVCSGVPISLRRLIESRLKEKEALIRLKLGHFPYRNKDSIAIWGRPGIESPQATGTK
jgi:dTDP-6-deoxy-L-talose 4-dehydrogenase (NAD+)